MSGAIHLWLPLLEAINSSISGFADHLLTSMLDFFTCSQEPSITRPTGSLPANSYPSEFIAAILTWLQVLTSTSSEYQITFGSHSSDPVDLNELVKQCVLKPTEWFVSPSFHPSTTTDIISEGVFGFSATLSTNTHLSRVSTAR